MSYEKLLRICNTLDSMSHKYRIGRLQTLRKHYKNLQREAVSGKIFHTNVFEDDTYAFHFGGRDELQFNVGFENVNGETHFRHGVAFSLEPSQSFFYEDLQKTLFPKIGLFNQYLSSNSDEYLDMRLWHYRNARSNDTMPASIPDELLNDPVFIFMGKHYPPDKMDYNLILTDFDRLLPLYSFIETGGKEILPQTERYDGFQFQPGCTIKKKETIGQQIEKQVNIMLYHNELQRKLYDHLVQKYGEEKVGTENITKWGQVDLVVHNENEFWFYEIKTSRSVRTCLRQAIGQLLEYGYWPGENPAFKIICCGYNSIANRGSRIFTNTAKYF